MLTGEALRARGILVLEIGPVGRDVAAHLGQEPQALRGPVRPGFMDLAGGELSQVDGMPLCEGGAGGSRRAITRQTARRRRIRVLVIMVVDCRHDQFGRWTEVVTAPR